MTKRLVKFGFASLAILAFTLLLVFRPDRAARSATGLTAHNLCSAKFVAGLDADATFRELVRPMIGPGIASLKDTSSDPNEKRRSSILSRCKGSVERWIA